MENQPNNQKPEETSSGSLLDQIMAAPAKELTPEEKAVLDQREKEAAEALKKPKKPLTAKEQLRVALALVFALAAVVATATGYVIFNPQLAVFFRATFGVQIGDVAKALGQILLGAFYVIMAFGVIGWVWLIVKAVLWKKTKGTGKFIVVLLAIMAGMIVNGSVVAGYSKAKTKLSQLEYLDAGVVLYDNDVYVQQAAGDKAPALIKDASQVIGPVTVRFDLDGFARNTMVTQGLKSIDRFEIDFDGDGTPDMDGTEVVGNQSFVWKYDKPKSGKAFQPTGTLYGTDVNKKEVAVQIPFPSISVVASVRVVETRERTGGVRVAFDAKDLQKRGNIEWRVESDPSKVASTSYEFTPTQAFIQTQWVCFNVYQGEKSDGTCQKYFVIRAEGDNLIDGNMALVPDPVDYLNYKFTIGDLKFKQGTLDSIRWYVDDLLQGDGPEIAYRFRGPGTFDVKAVVRDTSGNEKDFPERLIIDAPIRIMVKEGYGLKLADETAQDVIKDAYDKATNSYIVNDVPFPQTLAFDASNVKADSPRLRLRFADWDLDGDNQFEQTGALSAKLLLTSEKVYTVHVRYDFLNLDTDGERHRQTTETIVISTKKSAFDVRLNVIPDQDFAPAKVTLDASSSQARDGEIVKFVFDYGDGQAPAENSKGQSIHIYSVPGTYEAKVTAYKGDGANRSKTVTFTVRKPQNVATINVSISRGFAGNTVGFDATESRGNPQQILWDFGDGQTGVGEKVDHVYAKAGTYEVKLEIRYSDGAVETDKRTFAVMPNPDAQ